MVQAQLVFLGHYPDDIKHAKRYANRLNMKLVWVPLTRGPRLKPENVIRAVNGIMNKSTGGGYVYSWSEVAARMVKGIMPPSDCRDLSPSLDVFHFFEGTHTGKSLTTQWLIEHGLGQYAPKRYTEYNVENATLPIIVKPIVGRAGRHVSVIRTKNQLERLFHRVKNRSQIIFEEPIPNSTEWSAHFLALRGSLRMITCVNIVFQDDIFVRNTKPHGLRKVRWQHCPFEIDLLTRRLVSATNYHGIGCVGAKFNDSQPRMIEMNPRVCGMLFTKHTLMTSFLNASFDHCDPV